MRKFSTLIFLLVASAFLLTDCKRRFITEDIGTCDTIGNYYENGEHYIRRDLLKGEGLIDEDNQGVLDYQKMIESYTGKHTDCNPVKTW